MQSGQFGNQGATGQRAQQPGMTSRNLDQDGCVLTCTVSDCSYNKDLECYASAIAVGDDHPRCDTYTRDQATRPMQDEGIVMTCAVTMCNFNEEQHCHARGITVDHHRHHADCGTFRP